MTEIKNPYGQMCWFEVPVKSVSRAREFYSSVLGWECNDLEGTPSPTGRMKSVHMFTKGTLYGAFLLLHDADAAAEEIETPNTCVPLATFGVPSIEETVKKIEAAGGKIFMSVNSSPLCYGFL
jgi:predicted enzyme related to lactoylglutathione lyase